MNEAGLYLTAGGVVVLLAGSAFFSGSETALMSSSKAKLHAMEKDGVTGASRVNKMTDKPDVLLGTILLGNNLVNIGASALTTGLFIQLFGEVGIAYATIIMTLLVLIFAEVLPKTIASLYPERLALKVSPVMAMLIVLLRPFTSIIRFITNNLLKILQVSNKNENGFTEHDVRGAISLSKEHGVFEDGAHRMLDGVLDLDALTVVDVMIHRSQMTSIPASTPLQDIATLFATSPHSRLPIWEKNPDNIIGVLHIKDYYRGRNIAITDGTPFTLKDHITPAYFVPEQTSISQQLFEFRRLRRHLALVVDEYGDLQGLVTMEDILEEIVGEIEDEHDISTPDSATWGADNTVVITGDTTVRDANRDLKLNLPEKEDAVTLAGLMIDNLGHIPVIGEHAAFAHLTLTVLSKKRQTLTRIQIKKEN